jgi:hypothetical protein
VIKLRNILIEFLDVSTIGAYQLLTPGAKPDGGSDMDPRVKGPEQYNDGSTEVEYIWEFRNAKGRKMEITITLGKEYGGLRPNMIVAFGTGSRGDDKWKTMTGAGDLRMILATVIKAAQEAMRLEGIKGKQDLFAVSYQPADDRRERIYRYFIERYFPSFEFEKKNAAFKTFINKDYQIPHDKISRDTVEPA